MNAELYFEISYLDRSVYGNADPEYGEQVKHLNSYFVLPNIHLEA